LTAPVDYLGAVNKANKFANKSIELAQVNKAMQEFKITEGRNPKDLAELVESGFLAQEPKAPLRYGSQIRCSNRQGNHSAQAINNTPYLFISIGSLRAWLQVIQ
jgi:hypothetical protein